MGNQSGKVSVKSTKYIGDVDPKNSRTSWIAGTSKKAKQFYPYYQRERYLTVGFKRRKF